MQVKSFCGYIPAPECSQLLPGPPYDILDTKEARKEAEGNKYSVLRLNKPDLELDDTVGPYDDVVYAHGKENLDKFIENGWLVRDAPTIYAYTQAKAGHKQTGFVLLTAVEDYAAGRIKKHELTRKQKEDDRVRMVDTQNANVGPVYLSYKARDDLTSILDAATKTEPIVDIPCHPFDQTQHTLYRIPADRYAEIEKLFATVDTLYICDGHHRSQSAFRVGAERIADAEKAGAPLPADDPARWFLSVVFPHDQLRIFDYNRVVLDQPHDRDAVLAHLEKHFTVTPYADTPVPAPDFTKALIPEHPAYPEGRHTFSFYMGGQWYKLETTDAVDEADPIASIDSEILTRTVLKPLFGIEDLRSDSRINFVGGDRGLHGVAEMADAHAKTNACGFAVYPMTMDELFRVADAGMCCPPKSTYLMPKLLSGMVIRTITKDE